MMRTLIHILFLWFSFLSSGIAQAQIAIQHSQSFDGARIQMLNGHREEALMILKELYSAKRDSKTQTMIENFSTQFLNQDSEALFFHAINLIGARKFAEAKDKLDQANSKDPAHVLIIMRLGQVERELNLLEPAEEHLKFAAKLNPFLRDIKIMFGLLKISQNEDRDALKFFEPYKAFIQNTPALLCEYLPLLKRLEKTQEYNSIKRRIFSTKKPSTLEWMALVKDDLLNDVESKTVKVALKKCESEKEKCLDGIDQELKKLQYLWLPKEDPIVLLKVNGVPSR